MTLLNSVLRPSKVAHAHCDGPCGVYDPASARIAAEAAVSLTKKILDLKPEEQQAAHHTFARFVKIKEEQAEIAKRELEILWTDYFKPDHVQKYPELPDLILRATRQCSKVKQELNAQSGEDLLKMIQQVHEIFWATKNRSDVAFYRAG
jgi:nickel superoxide dismutase